jgi:antitoxin CptB
MKELDVLLERYLETAFDDAPIAEQTAFESVLELQDPELYAYLTGRDCPEDPHVRAMVQRILDASCP